jgi:BirA family transcriptional regulator, biotin operon repressor / biotin---[acetyl-CoA-carboxylase] ligase
VLQCGEWKGILRDMELTAENVQARLAPRWNAVFYEHVDSTNDIAMAHLRENRSFVQTRAAGDVIIADEQMKGKGRLGRTWYTPPGTALIVSVIFPVEEREHLPRITMLGAVAIAEMIENSGMADVGIKWPNDVQVNGKKVSGILAEVNWVPGGATRMLWGVVLGMGVNVRIDFSETELADTAISIEPALGKSVDRLDLLSDLMGRIDYWYGRIGSPELFDAWKSHLNMLGKIVTVQQGTIHGFAESVDERGTLLVRDEQGELHRVMAGDIALGS